jgi:hypothetical protein
LADTSIDIAADLLETPAQLLDLIGEFLDPASQLPHALFQTVHAKLGINRHAGVAAHWRRRAAIDLALQHAEIAFDTVEAVLRRAVLAKRRRRRNKGCAAERDSETSTLQQGSPEHKRAST